MLALILLKHCDQSLIAEPFMAIVQTSASAYGVFHIVVQLAVGWTTNLPMSLFWHISEKN
jgi:hypothetical protein